MIENGIGYDAGRRSSSTPIPSTSRKVLNVGELVGVKEGGNPHQWYSPDSVQRVRRPDDRGPQGIDPKNAAYFDAAEGRRSRRTGWRNTTRSSQRSSSKYAGTPVGASESIFTPLAEALGLKLVTPESFLDAISEGTDPTAQDKATVDSQIKNKQIKVFVFNSQNATPDVKAPRQGGEGRRASRSRP